jgi:hypothetical protein
MSKISNLMPRSLSRTLYVRISRDRLQVRHIETGRALTLDAQPPFSGARLLVAQFTPAQALLRRAVREVTGGGFGLAPVLLLHPLELVEDGVSESERRLLLDLGYGIGAREVAVVTTEPSDAQARRLARRGRQSA